MEEATTAPAPKPAGNMKTVKKLDVISVAKLQAILLAIGYGFAGVFMFLSSLLMGDAMGFGMVMAIIVMFGGIVVGLVVGFIGGAIGAWLYNLVAGKVGGIRVELV